MGEAPVKVLHIVHALGMGGMESRIARLAYGLPRDRFRVSVISLKPAPGATLELPADVEHRLYAMPPGLHPRRLLGLAARVRAGAFDIVHTHNWSSMFYGIAAARLAGVPLVIHGEHGLNRQDLDGIPAKRLWAQRVLARMAHHIVPVNDVIAAHVSKAWKLDGRRMTVIPNGVDLARFRTAPKQVSDSGTIGGKAFSLGMVGRLDDVKDIGCALRALRLLSDGAQGEGLRLILVGSGPMEADLRAEAERLGVSRQVEFAGPHADVENWYPRFDLYLNTSVYEGMSNTLLEAMAAGLPLIASRVPGNAAWLREGENARFFSPGDAESLAAAIRSLRENGEAAATMAARNRNRVEEEFDNRGFLAAYMGLYGRLLAQRR
jgi:glycosyltransferase involved in cell wall biosynthesis